MSEVWAGCPNLGYATLYLNIYIINIYSVMQSDGNNFYGDVVSDSFNKTSRDEDNILEQIY